MKMLQWFWCLRSEEEEKPITAWWRSFSLSVQNWIATKIFVLILAAFVLFGIDRWQKQNQNFQSFAIKKLHVLLILSSEEALRGLQIFNKRISGFLWRKFKINNNKESQQKSSHHRFLLLSFFQNKLIFLLFFWFSVLKTEK